MGKSSANPSLIGILGGGVAGMSCALWLGQLGYQTALIERGSALGGQLLGIKRENRWVLGFPGMTSVELAKCYADHISQVSVGVWLNANPIAFETIPDGYLLQIQRDGQTVAVTVQALVIATGARALGMETFHNLPGFGPAQESTLIGSYPLDHLDWLPTLNGQRIAVIGGGDNACFTAKDAALAGANVHLLMRSPAKAQAQILTEIAMLARTGRITLHGRTTLAGFKLQPDGIALALSTTGENNPTNQWLTVDRVFIRIGFAANSEFLHSFPAFSGLNKQQGYIITDTAKRTNLPRLYAIGDVANPNHQSVVAALADGALAARTIAKDGL